MKYTPLPHESKQHLLPFLGHQMLSQEGVHKNILIHNEGKQCLLPLFRAPDV